MKKFKKYNGICVPLLLSGIILGGLLVNCIALGSACIWGAALNSELKKCHLAFPTY